MVHLPWTSVVPLVTFKGSTSEVVGFLCFAGLRGCGSALPTDDSVDRNGEMYLVRVGSLILKPPR